MRYEFLKQPMVSTSWKVTAIIILISVCGYIIWNNFVSAGSLIFMAILTGITTILFLFNQVIVVDTAQLRLSNINRFGGIKIYEHGTVDISLANRIIFNESKYTKTTTSQRSFKSVTGTGYEYNAFLKLNDNTSFYLGTSDNRETYLNQLSKLAYVLNIELRDNT
ncbi:MAG: hypothetical protein ABJN36_08890 [Cyclobacteriaceae bacterium]